MPRSLIHVNCTIKDGWANITFSRRATLEVQDFIRQYIRDNSVYDHYMASIHRLSLIYLELNKTDCLEMLSREDLTDLSKCIPNSIESTFMGFYRSNFFKSDRERFKEGNQLMKAMFEIHEV